MSKFKVGDKVRTFVGIGVIKYINNDDAPYLVYYQGWNKGHNGSLSQMNFSGNHCLWHVEDALFAVNELSSSRQTLPLSSIHITSAFSDHPPDSKKITKCYEFYKANGEFNKDIVINMRNVLVDGYVAYLIAKMVGMKNVPVLQTNSDTLDKPKRAKKTEKPAKAAPKFKVGDKVKIINSRSRVKSKHVGKVFEISCLYPNGITMWNEPNYGLENGFVWFEDELEPYSEPAPTSAAPDKQDVVKLYCVKECKPGQWLTKGNVYNVVNGRITFDDGYVDDYDDVPISEIGTEIDSLCVPLVKRPAKVGEWVLLTEEPLVNEADHCGVSFAVDYHKGDLVKITHFGIMPSVRSKIGGQYSGFRDHEYLVLDGYQPEPEKPKYYSGKVVCVDNDGDTALTVGKVYQCENGVVRWDDGEPMKNRFESVQHMNDCFAKSVVTNAKFIELKQ